MPGTQLLYRFQTSCFLNDSLSIRTKSPVTHRSSSLVENLNGRLRNYFFQRRNLGQGYLDLLRFFLNHRVFMRSEQAERIGKSPTELMTGKPHPHWLELLGFELFRQPPVSA